MSSLNKPDRGGDGRTFDVPMLSAEFRRVGVTWPKPDLVQVDVRRVWERQEPRTLAAAVTRWLGIAEYDGHRAISDASKTLAVLQEMAKRYGVRDAAGLADLERDPDWVDSEGKFKMVNGVVTITIGQKWKDKPLSVVDDRFLGWMLSPKATFAEDTKEIVRAELERRRRMADDAHHDYEHPLLDVAVPANWGIR